MTSRFYWLLILGFLPAFSLAAPPLKCAYKTKEESVSLTLKTRFEGTLEVTTGQGSYRCRVDVVDVGDLRNAIKPMVRLNFRRPEGCEPAHPRFEKSLVREGTLDIYVFRGKPVGDLNVMSLKGFERCSLSGYSREFLNLPDRVDSDKPAARASGRVYQK
ncbi:MAG TPA: hypothetical protein PL182_03700 [Pseudobdellovibrionaceae bacterium]|nr:hypothetical protein [Pseudobdellovibrionaceae bacterium]